jgi:hypothetical protein
LKKDPKAWVGIPMAQLHHTSDALKKAAIKSGAHRADLAVDLVIDDEILFVRITPGSNSFRPPLPAKPAPATAAPEAAPAPPAPPVIPTPAPKPASKKTLDEIDKDRQMGIKIEQALDDLATMEPGDVVEPDLGPRSEDWSKYHKEASVTARSKGLKVSTDRTGPGLIVQLVEVPETSKFRL